MYFNYRYVFFRDSRSYEPFVAFFVFLIKIIHLSWDPVPFAFDDLIDALLSEGNVY